MTNDGTIDYEELVKETLELADEIDSIAESFIIIEEDRGLTVEQGKTLVEKCLPLIPIGRYITKNQTQELGFAILT